MGMDKNNKEKLERKMRTIGEKLNKKNIHLSKDLALDGLYALKYANEISRNIKS